ncbi:MAG: hypothetical protein KJ645_06740 [Planctomycetes bacterium]|nr:hypothetical protein [Planctomycetota bacterium]
MGPHVTRYLVLAVLLPALYPFFPAKAQEYSPEERAFWIEYQKAIQEDDPHTASRMIRRGKEIAHRIADKLILQACNEYRPVDEEMAKAFMADLFKSFKDAQYLHELDFVLSLDSEGRYKRRTAWDAYFEGHRLFNRGKDNPGSPDLQEAVKHYLKAIELVEEIGDLVLIAEVSMRCAICYETMEQAYEACVYFDNALTTMETLPYQAKDLEYVRYRYDHYIKLGFDPIRPKDEGGMPDDLSGVFTKEENPVTPNFILGKETISEPFAYGTMKTPFEFITPAFNTGQNSLLWPGAWFDADKNPHALFQPFFGYTVGFYGKNVGISKERSSYYLDIEGNPKTLQEIKATQKVGRIELRDTEKDKEKKPYRYQFFLQIPAEEEEMFGLTIQNIHPEPNAIEVRVRTGCCTRGKLLGQKCVIIDDNGDGIFGDGYRMGSDFVTQGEYSFWRPDAIVIGRENKARPWSDFQNIDGGFYAIKVDKYGRDLKATPVTVETGKLNLVWDGDHYPLYLILHLIDDANPGTFFDVANYRSPTTLPAGTYEIACGKIETGAPGRVKQIRIYNGKAKRIVIEADKETLLELGAPFRFTFEPRKTAGEYVIPGESVQVWGKQGELYAKFFDKIPLPTVSVRYRDSKAVVVRGETMKPSTLDDYYRAPGRQWHPLDFKLKTSEAVRMQAKLFTKKIEFLGGPVESRWF